MWDIHRQLYCMYDVWTGFPKHMISVDSMERPKQTTGEGENSEGTQTKGDANVVTGWSDVC